jgi:hypothetical protein
MTNAVLIPEIVALRNGIVSRLLNHTNTLYDLARIAEPVAREELLDQAHAISKVATEQAFRLRNITSVDEVIALINIIRLIATFDEENERGTQLAIDHIFSYINAAGYLDEGR